MRLHWPSCRITGWSALLLAAFLLQVEAADILRRNTATTGSGGTTAGTVPNSAVTAGMPSAQDRLARNAQTLQALKTMQAAARAAAVAGANNLGADPKRPGVALPNVPNGLAAGGLQVDPRVATDPTLWTGAALPTETVVGGQTKVTVEQQSSQAVLNWSSFNIGKQTTLRFDQSAGGADQTKWIAFNKVNDPAGVPSQILGRMEADGQVYVINPNGIIFGGSAQINLNTLVASALPINDNLIERGLLNNPDTQFLFSALPLAAGANGTPAFTPATPATPDGQPGDVTVQAGAQITTTTSADNTGGRVALIGANVSNAGHITVPDGQAILAAGLQVGMAAHSANDASLRGVDVYVGAVTDPNAPAGTPRAAGTASNTGLIEVPRGNATLVGAEINQNGFINSTTSVSLNGRIDLQASYDAIGSGGYAGLPSFFSRNTGTLRLGADSVLQVLPEWSSEEKVVGTELALRSQVNLEGRAIYLGADSSILAPNANVTIQAGAWDLRNAGSSVAAHTFVTPSGTGQVYFDTGASVDVSGTRGAEVSVADNIVAVQLNAAELADSPLLRDSLLRGETVYVDIRNTGTYDGRAWIGTPLADAAGYANLIERSVGELTTAGGTVAIKAGESVILQSGAKIDVSGGWVNYLAGNVSVTRLLYGSSLLNMNQATPDRLYDGLVNSTRYEAGYVQGKDAGRISITAPAMALDGRLVGRTVTGQRQQQSPPRSGTLALAWKAQDISSSTFYDFSPTPPAIMFQTASSLPAANPFTLDAAGHDTPLRAERQANVTLSPDLLGNTGFGHVTIENGDGNITVPAGIELRTVAGGSLALSAANINIAGTITAPGGTLQFEVYEFTPFLKARSLLTAPPAANPDRGQFTLAATARLSVAGTTALQYSDVLAPVRVHGGSITIKGHEVNLADGSVLDVSGGVATSATGKRTYGNGGTISISAGQDPNIPSLVGGRLTLGATLRGYSGAKGGALSLLAPVIQIGGTTASADTLLLAPSFFSAGGFASFTLRGLGLIGSGPDQFVPGLTIAANTVIAPRVQNCLVVVNANGVPTLTTYTPPDGLRTPVSLTFGAVGVRDSYRADPLVVRGDLVMNDGAVIRTDPQGAVSFNGDTVTVLGRVETPGGSIAVAGGANSSALFLNQQQALTTVHLGPNSVLSARGAVVLKPDARGFRTGSVLAGGRINISGNILAEAGARLDVSGASGVLDVVPSYAGGSDDAFTDGGLTRVARRIDSDGGSIVLAGAQQLVSLATLNGAAGGATANGGSLTVSSGRFYSPQTPNSARTPLDITLTVAQQDVAVADTVYPAGETAIGRAVLDAADQPLAGQGYFAADRFAAGGFDSLTLRGTVEFDGPVTITANRSLALADKGVLFADAAVRLAAPAITIGTAFQTPQADSQIQTPFRDGEGRPLSFAPTTGDGELTLEATSLIDIGTLSLQQIGRATFSAVGGDIRGNGTLEMAGELTLRAGQIYPPTAVGFTIAAYDYLRNGSTQPGTIRIAAGGTRSLPLSAGGTLSVYGSRIEHNGVLRAPLGRIRLGWDGTGTAPTDLLTGTAFPVTQQLTLGPNSVTSVSAIDPVTGQAWTIPYGINRNDTDWIDPTGTAITVSGPQAKSVLLSARNLDVNAEAEIDLRGGGDLYAYRWVRGNGGTRDILSSTTSFAIVPGYTANYAPFAPYNANPVESGVFGGDAGYVNTSLAVGDQIYLAAGSGLPAGVYTLLPARYATLPGAYLVTPLSGTPVTDAASQPDGATVVSGYRFNSLNAERVGTPLLASFQVAPAAVVSDRAEYQQYRANTALATDTGSQRLPRDAAQLVFTATQTMSLDGRVLASAASQGRRGLVDISSPQPILIAGDGVAGQSGVLVLSASELSRFNAASLLIGGTRQTDASGTKVTVQTGQITVDNAGSALAGADIILAAKNELTLAAGAQIAGTGSGTAETLTLGDASTAGSGNGVAVRVSADANAALNRADVNAATQPSLTIGDNARVTGNAVIVDSTRETTIAPTAILDGNAISLASGRISLALTDPGALPPDAGLVLSGTTLQDLQSGAQKLSLLSYSALDLYGVGAVGNSALADLALSAAELRGFNQNGGTVTFAAQHILLDNRASGTVPVAVAPATGALVFDANLITLGANACQLNQFQQVELRAAQGVQFRGTGSLTASGDLLVRAPVVTGATGANQTLRAAGAITLAGNAGAAGVTPGLGAQLTLAGADVSIANTIRLPSGWVSIEAATGDVRLDNGGQVDVSGVARTFFDQTRHTDGGEITLRAAQGSVAIANGSTLNVSAPAGGGNAGQLTLSAPNGTVTLNGTLRATSGATKQAGTFQLDTGALPDPSLATWNTALNLAGFTETRSFRVRQGDVVLDGLATARSFALAADGGDITVAGTVDASGATGGRINLAAAGSVTVEPTARLSVAAQEFDSAGQGGRITLAAGQAIQGQSDPTAQLDIQSGAVIDLSVAAAPTTLDQRTGTLHLRAPQTADNLDVRVAPLDGTVRDASRIIVEGVALFDLDNPAGAVIDDAVRAAVWANGTTFGGNSAALADRLLANNAALAPVLRVRPGAEIFNPSGDLTLNTSWDLSSYRFGPQNQPGVLTLRAAGNLNFDYNSTTRLFASLSDGFASATYNAPLLPAGTESWSYRLVAGADFGAADSLAVRPLDALGAQTGSLLLGRYAQLKGAIPNSTQPAQNIIPGYFQTIRTGTGDIEISAGRDVQLLSPLATIYTAGMQAEALADFDLPDTSYPTGTALGSVQYSEPYPAQYSYRGGNVTIVAQNDIARYQVNASGALTADSTRELPSNWLYRRGYLDPTTGEFGITHNDGEIASTSWWVDFSNFFEDIGALGGGQVTLTAGRDVSNVDAVVPTNARMPHGTPATDALVELGGGDLHVVAGRDINGGVYYVERGTGTLRAGRDVRTNPTRAALDQTTMDNHRIRNTTPDATTWLPTTLFVGQSRFSVAARGDVLLGPVANVFLMPQGINNSFYQKSYFCTYSADAGVDVTSLTSTLTVKDSANNTSDGSAGSLAAWYQNVLLFTQNANSYASKSQPWLRLAETKITLAAFSTVFGLMPPTLQATALAGDLNVIGNLTLAPSATGTLDLLAAGAINGLQPNGVNSINRKYQWGSSRINVSDADPQRVPRAVTPLSLTYLGPDASSSQERSAWSNPQQRTINGVFQNINALFAESGSTLGTYGVLQTKLALHASGPLHAGDTQPVRLYAQAGDISGLTLFAGKATRVLAGRDITDISLYIQNVNDDDLSVVSAGRDIIAYFPNSALRTLAQQGNNEILLSQAGRPVGGDIQISGPGTLEVLAGRNLDLGIGPNASDGTALGITSIGNARNPALPSTGADILVVAGLGTASTLAESALDVTGFIAAYLDPATAGSQAAQYLPALRTLLELPAGTPVGEVWHHFCQLPAEQQALLAMDIFYLVLRDAGRNYNIPTSAGYKSFAAGYNAIAKLFPATHTWQGNVSLTSRQIKTAAGGNISLLVPGGGLLVGFDISGNQPVDQGVLTEAGGDIAIFTRQSVTAGTSRIFTLRGGNIIIWSSAGDIAAGASSKTVQSAPPTRVLIDPQTGSVRTDLAGLATGGGIGVLTTVAGVAPGDVDLIAPAGTIDAGDAGIRVSGNINLAALQVLNAGNIQVQGGSVGVPAVSVAVNVGGLQVANTTVAATTASATAPASSQARETLPTEERVPSLISVEVLGYGGGEGATEEEEE